MTLPVGVTSYLLPGGDRAPLPPPGGAWTCTACGSFRVWTDEHRWWGSWLDVDGGKPGRRPQPIVVTCSDACRRRAKVQGLVE